MQMEYSIDSQNMIVALLISTGAILMMLSLIRYKKVLGNRDDCKTIAGSNLRILHGTHLVLMGFFIFGYLVVLVSILAGIHLVSELFVSLIFFFGAVFVLFGVVIQEKMLSSLRDTYTNSVKMLVSAVEIRDPYTIGHSEHVANLLVTLWDHLPDRTRPDINKNALMHAGLLHDIGKIGVPEVILNKTTPLNDEEWMLIREHPEIGSAMIGKLEELECIADWIKYHHERVDGKGYYKLTGASTPYVSKLIAVVDTYSALVTDRPYRRGKSHDEALAIMVAHSNSQLDAELVDKFASISPSKLEKCRPDALVRDFLEEHRMVEDFQGPLRDIRRIEVILPREPGALCLNKLLDYAIQEKLHLSMAEVKLTNIPFIDREFGYHAADNFLTLFGKELLQNVRDTDVVINSNRTTFILAFADCQSSLAMHLAQRIQTEIAQAEFYQQYSDILSIENRIVYYNPKDVNTHEHAQNFVSSLAETNFGLS